MMETPANDAWLQTYEGRCARILDPDVSMISPIDVAHALSNQCRFLGHVRTFYSVAQHSVIVSEAVPSDFALAGLLHDAAEAYLGDMIRPIKRHTEMGHLYHAIEQKWMRVIEQFFGLARHSLEHPSVVTADRRTLLAEKRDLIPAVEPAEWEDMGVNPLEKRIEPLNPFNAKELFLKRLEQVWT